MSHIGRFVNSSGDASSYRESPAQIGRVGIYGNFGHFERGVVLRGGCLRKGGLIPLETVLLFAVLFEILTFPDFLSKFRDFSKDNEIPRLFPDLADTLSSLTPIPIAK